MKKQGLSFQFSLMFAGFTVITLAVCSIISYHNQMRLYKKQREESIQSVANYLERRIVADSEDFVHFQNYFLSHSDDFRVALDFGQEDLDKAREEFETIFAREYPGKVLGKDIQFEELSDEVKKADTLYNLEYYTLMFEDAVKAFDIAYAYYVTPGSELETMYWPICNIRDPIEIDGKTYLLLNTLIPNSHENNPPMWEAWDTGKIPKNYKIYDNEYGKTYAYYRPLFINDKKLGVIGVEVEIASVNRSILFATIQQMVMIGGVLIVFVAFLLALIRSKYISKLVRLQNKIDEYSKTKDEEIAYSLARDVTNSDEISLLMHKFAEMIFELESYMKNLSKTQADLQESRKFALEQHELAVKDSLTGVRNKTSYDKEVQKVEWEISCGKINVGAAMIDLNFLKRINDTFGHDKGDIAIVSLSKIVCKIFEHSPVFRIGGDEFIIILKGEDLKNIDFLVSEFNTKIATLQFDTHLEYWEKISAAIGYAIYNPTIDASFASTFKRADTEMYKAKKSMKAIRRD